VAQVGSLCVYAELQGQFQQPLQDLDLLWQVALLLPPCLFALAVLIALLLQLRVLQGNSSKFQEMFAWVGRGHTKP
jgi:hypothetical protein